MAAQANAQPIIIKRKKKGGGDGHHGGAWKVAYADFVTAMMAFFMLMWLLNATTEKQRKGLADYFSPTIPINRVSGGGDGAFGGDSIFTEETLPRNGTGASSLNPTEQDKSRGQSGADPDAEGKDAQEEVFESINKELQGRGGESAVMDNALEHIVTRVTDEGVILEVFSRPDAPLFEPGTAIPTQLLRDIADIVADTSKITSAPIAISGHVPAEPIVKNDIPVWETSTEQASAMRILLERARFPEERIRRVSGYADREQQYSDPLDIRNNRLEIIYLRE